jgi:hypothetical protein
MPSLPPPLTTTTINNAAIGAVSSIPPLPPPPLTTTAIAAVDNRHCRCRKVDNADRQKPVVIVCCQLQQWQSLLTDTVV